jgi:DNA-entry nuclease
MAKKKKTATQKAVSKAKSTAKRKAKKTIKSYLLKGLAAVVVLVGAYFGYDFYEDSSTSSTDQTVETSNTTTDSDSTGTSEAVSSNSTTYTASDDFTTWTYTGDAYTNIDDGLADFTAEEIAAGETSFETYSEQDSLGRCTQAYASVGQDLMPADGEKRGSISSVKPSGWQSTKYDSSLVEGGYLYNRCHLIGWQLTAENANKCNLVTGTRYLNIDGMLGFENQIADYVKETGNHVLYRVTPYYVDDELVPRGLRMEAYSVEDNGEGINFDVWAYNVQPGITINYADGTSELAE